jgi:hypothetical protein
MANNPTFLRIGICYGMCAAVLICSSAGFSLASSGSDTDRRFDALERDNAVIRADHYEIMQQVATDTRALADLTDLVNKHHKSQEDYPALLATLDVKLTWLLRGIGAVILGGAGWMWNRVRYANRVAEELRDHAKRVVEYQEIRNKSESVNHQSVISELESARAEANAAYAESNTVNQKIASIGMEMKDHGPAKGVK